MVNSFYLSDKTMIVIVIVIVIVDKFDKFDRFDEANRFVVADGKKEVEYLFSSPCYYLRDAGVTMGAHF